MNLTNEQAQADGEYIAQSAGDEIRQKNYDLISRQTALKELKESAEHHANDNREEALLRRDRDIIRALPSVNPQPKKGHWKDNKCDVCGASRPPLFDNYCPNCGCLMEIER